MITCGLKARTTVITSISSESCGHWVNASSAFLLKP
jgi:hypothetical protein